MKNFINSLVLVYTFIFNYGANAEMTNNTSIKMITNVGNIQIELFNDKSPITAGNFIKYIEAGYFSGTIFHRVIKDFMIQGGGFDTDMNESETRPSIENEADNGLKITAFKVTHEPIEPALCYRFDYKGRSLVISGDTSYDENLALNSENADVLIAEAQANHIINIMQEALLERDPNQPLVKVLEDIKTYHMTPIEAAKLANMANVGHLIFYHLTPAPRNRIMENVFVRGVDEIRTDWTLSKDGTFVVLPVGTEEINLSDLN